MSRYDFTDYAETDLDSIIDYSIKAWGKAQAQHYLDGLVDLAQNLADTPDLGVNRSSLYQGLISFPYVSHILYYIKQPHGITIVRVLHKKMDAKKHLSSSYEAQ